jgi:hypothetical protein
VILGLEPTLAGRGVPGTATRGIDTTSLTARASSSAFLTDLQANYSVSVLGAYNSEGQTFNVHLALLRDRLSVVGRGHQNSSGTQIEPSLTMPASISISA